MRLGGLSHEFREFQEPVPRALSWCWQRPGRVLSPCRHSGAVAPRKALLSRLAGRALLVASAALSPTGIDHFPGGGARLSIGPNDAERRSRVKTRRPVHPQPSFASQPVSLPWDGRGPAGEAGCEALNSVRHDSWQMIRRKLASCMRLTSTLVTGGGERIERRQRVPSKLRLTASAAAAR